MSTTFYKGEKPSTPLVITVTDDDGQPKDLSIYADVSIVPIDTPGLPIGVCSISDTTTGRVQYDFSEPFEDAVVLVLQVRMATSGDDVDLSAPFTLTVLDPNDAGVTLVTPPQVENWTGQSVSQQQVVQAQYQISLAVGADLFDEEWIDSLGSKDRYWLNLAVAYQAADIAKVDSSTAEITVPYLPGVQSISTGDQSISFGSGADTGGVATQANTALRRLSWMRPIRTLHAKPFLRSLTPEEAAAVVVSGFGWRP